MMSPSSYGDETGVREVKDYVVGGRAVSNRDCSGA
jgi:hypothetical protein